MGSPATTALNSLLSLEVPLLNRGTSRDSKHGQIIIHHISETVQHRIIHTYEVAYGLSIATKMGDFG